jgi:hypothetical protein
MGSAKGRSIGLMLTNGATAYRMSTLYIDGIAQTIKWQNGVALSGNVNSTDLYSISVIKTATNTYTVLGTMSKFA